MREKGYSMNNAQGLAIAFCAVFALSGCASQQYDPPHFFDKLVAERNPPLVLRVPSEEILKTNTVSAGGELAGGALGGVFGSLYLLGPTLGASLILLPMGVFAGAQGAMEAAKCNKQWEAEIGNVPEWLDRHVRAADMLQILEDEIRAELGARGQSTAFYGSIRQTSDKMADQRKLQQIIEKLGVPVIVVGNTHLGLFWEFGKGPKRDLCTVTIKAFTFLKAIDGSASSLDKPLADQSVIVSRPQADPEFVKAWAKNPESAKEWIRDALRELAARIAALYPKRD
jgi:hypothetical protein